MLGACYRREKNRPELAIVAQGIVELRALAVPAVMNGLQARGGFEQQIGFQGPRIVDLARDHGICLRGVWHCREAPACTQSICWRPLTRYTFSLLRYDY